MLRYIHGAEDDGYSVTALYYHGHSNLTTDQPERAVQEGLIGPVRYARPFGWRALGAVQPVRKVRDQRRELELRHRRLRHPQHHDPVERLHPLSRRPDRGRSGSSRARAATPPGGQAAYPHPPRLRRSIASDTELGVQGRYDDVYVDRRHTHDRVVLNYCENEQDPGPGRRLRARGRDARGGRAPATPEPCAPRRRGALRP